MKRLLIIASLAILAMSCEKTIVSNGVRTPIGFSTEVGKQTRAVVQNAIYPTDQPFAVYAYGHQVIGNDDETTTIMDNVEVFNDGQTPAKWSATGETKYYWPNDPRTKINFYAYSPALVANPTATANHQKLNGTIVHRETADNSGPAGLSLTGYTHSNMYVDFMVATPVLNATFGDQDGDGNSGPNAVPVSFAHQMTQVNFTVKLVDQASYPNVDFTINSITLNAIYDQADYISSGQNRWTAGNNKRSYTVFPAVITGDNAAPIQAAESAVVLHTDARAATLETPENPAKTSFNTTPVTMIPQTFVASGNQTVGHSFTINYTIEGVGVATETVEKTFDLPAGTNDAWTWIPNRKITYVLSIGLNEILFAPTVVVWDETTSEDINI